MPTPWTRARLGLLVATGMVLLLAGVVAGAAVGNLIAPEQVPDEDPLLIGEANTAGGGLTRLFAANDSATLLTRQRDGGLAIQAESDQGSGGLFVSHHDDGDGLIARQRGDPGVGAALTAQGGENIGVRAISDRAFGLLTAGGDVALYSNGNAVVAGDLAVHGTCTGCQTAVLAINDSDAALQQGDAVTITGIVPGEEGALMLTVAPAEAGDRVIGIVDTAVRHRTPRVMPGERVGYDVADPMSMRPGSTVRVVTQGLVAAARADATGGVIAVGDSLVAGSAPGILSRRSADEPPGSSIGIAAGPVEDGLVPIFIWPN